MNFLNSYQSWLTEGCYSDLLELVTLQADEVILLNLPISLCVENSETRPWEPQNIKAKKLKMLIGVC